MGGAAVVARALRKPDKRLFYAEALSEAERADLGAALDVEGFEEEIATLRLRLRSHLEERPKDLALMLRGLDLLRRMVATKYGLSRGDQRGLSGFAEETMRRLEERGEGGGGDGDG